MMIEKVHASGIPNQYKDDKEGFVTAFLAAEGLKLNIDKIEYNTGLRTLCKLL